MIPDSEQIRYISLQVASHKFGASPNHLPDEQRVEVEDIARKQIAIQSKILSSPNGSQILIPPDRIESEVSRVKSRYSNEEQFTEELAGNGITEVQFRNAIERELRVEAILDRVAANVKPCTETDARLYYYLHPEKFQQPESREASHILITVNPNYPENERQAAQNRAAIIARRLQKKPNRFSEQALKNSECPTAMNGGDLGRVKKGVLFPTLNETLFSMAEGSVSDVLESPMGFHVLLCSKIHHAGPIAIADAIPLIIEKLTERNRNKFQKNWIKTLCSSE